MNTAAIDGLNDHKNNYDEAQSDPNSMIGTSANKTNGNSVATDEEEDTESNIDNANRSESKVTEERVLARIANENTELNNRIDIYDKQLEDAKVAVLKAASVIQKLTKILITKESRKAYKTTCEELKQKLKARLEQLKNKK